MKQPIHAAVAEKIGRITALAVEITSEGRYDVFADWSGHVRNMHVYAFPADTIYAAGVERVRVANIEAFTDSEHAIQQLDNIITVMETLR